jgi:hypothetical protein
MTMDSRCQHCGEPAARVQDAWLLCEKCASRFEEYDRNAEARDAGLLQWNTSQHDPFWRGWLTSWELYAAIRDTAPRIGRRILHIAGGDVFDCSHGVPNRWLQVWLSDNEVLVAYPPYGELYGWAESPDGPQEFSAWARHLRNSPPLELGRVRGRCSYGATRTGVKTPPVVKWAQAGDWAAGARAWHVGEGRVLAPWP